MDDNILVNLINDTNKLLEEKQRQLDISNQQLDISNQQLKLGELLNNDLQKEVDRLNGKLEEKQKIIDEQLEIIRKIALTGDGSHKEKHASFYDCLPTLQLEFSERVEFAREYLKRVGSEK